MRTLSALAVVGFLSAMIGCASGPLSAREKGFLGGGAAGAGLGAIIGHQSGDKAEGAAIGGAAGALGGAIIGDQMDAQRRRY